MIILFERAAFGFLQTVGLILQAVLYYGVPLVIAFAWGYWAGIHRERKNQKNKLW